MPSADAVAAFSARAAFETACAPCHGPEGQGGSASPLISAPRIAGTSSDAVARQVRLGGVHMPAFGQAAFSDSGVRELAQYVEGSLGHPARTAASVGPNSLSPMGVGVYAWAGLLVLSAACAALFGHARN